MLVNVVGLLSVRSTKRHRPCQLNISKIVSVDMQRCTVFVLIFGALGFRYMSVVGVFKSNLTARSQIFSLAAQVFKILA